MNNSTPTSILYRSCLNGSVCVMTQWINETVTAEMSTSSLDGQYTLRSTLLMLIACIGLIGNTLNLIVLHSYHTAQITYGGECTARVNLLGLASADFLVCLTSLPLGYVKRRHQSYTFMLFYTIVGPGLVTYFLAISVWMVLLMSVVRYIAVCRPLTSRAWLTSRHMCRVIVLIYVIGLLFHIPSFLMFTYDKEHDWSRARSIKCSKFNESKTIEDSLCSHSTTLVVYERPFWRSETVDVTHHVIHILFTNIAPFIGVVVSNIAVIRACRRSDQCRRTGNIYDFSGPSRSHPIPSSPRQKLVLKTNQPGNGVQPNSDPWPVSSSRLMISHNARAVSCRIPPIAIASPSPSYMNRCPNTATNRVTPLLLAVIFAFLLFTAPFGIVHFVCLRLMRNLGVRVRDNWQARQLYTALNLTLEWTNVVQLLSCASNFFLYFLVSTTFRRTTRRTFRRIGKNLRTCHRTWLSTMHSWFHSTETESWEPDNRLQVLQTALDRKVPTPVRLRNGLGTPVPAVKPIPLSYTELIRPNAVQSQYSCANAALFNRSQSVSCPQNCPCSEVMTYSCACRPQPQTIRPISHTCSSWTGVAIYSEPLCCTARCSASARHSCGYFRVEQGLTGMDAIITKPRNMCATETV